MTLRRDPVPHRPRILIVDDERQNRALMEVMLTPEGFSLMTASTGEEALAMVAVQPPDLILLDIMMPGMDGYQVASRIKSNLATKDIPVIMVTALNDQKARMLGLQAGAEEFLSKPIDRAELVVRVRNLSRLKTAGDARHDEMLKGEVDSRTAALVNRTETLEQQAVVLTEQAELAARHEELRNAQMRFKDEFLSHVSHELRSPLTAIKQFTTILLGGLAGALTTEQADYQKIVLKNVGQLQSMIDDLLEVTRLETGKLTLEPESTSVASAVTDTFNTLQGTAGAKGVTVTLEIPEGLPRAYADKTRLRQVLIILLDNAIKFTPAGGSVSIRAHRLDHDPRFLMLEVSDTGCGIDPAMAERIFERLYQVTERIETSRKGLGLGLYICKELVTRQGGEIRAARLPEGGSTFFFTLPVFSLDNVLAPLLKNDTWPRDTVALLVVDSGRTAPWASPESREEWRHTARGVLQSCLLPDLDVLLPQIGYGDQAEHFCIVAFADEAGASVLVNRIRGQFERLSRAGERELTFAVSYTMLAPLPASAGASVERTLAVMTAHLEQAMNAYLSPEPAPHA